MIKTLHKNNLVNGSHLKKVVDLYHGNFKSINDILVPMDTLILINKDKEEIIKCPYVVEADDKLGQKDLFKLSEIKQNIPQEIVKNGI